MSTLPAAQTDQHTQQYKLLEKRYSEAELQNN